MAVVVAVAVGVDVVVLVIDLAVVVNLVLPQHPNQFANLARRHATPFYGVGNALIATSLVKKRW
jgi:hypothetical protein